MFPLREALGNGCSETCRSGQTNNGMTTATVTAATRCGAPNVFRLVVVADNPLAHSPFISYRDSRASSSRFRRSRVITNYDDAHNDGDEEERLINHEPGHIAIDAPLPPRW